MVLKEVSEIKDQSLSRASVKVNCPPFFFLREKHPVPPFNKDLDCFKKKMFFTEEK